MRYEPDRAKKPQKTEPREYDRPTEGPTTATLGDKRKITWRVKTLPVSLAVSTSLPASPVDLASVVNIDNKDDENIVLDIGDYPIVTDPIAPET